jgi:uncharacterized protein YbjT (DUF2867 family)
MISKIAFIGATGMLGKPVAIQLDKAGFNITALVRESSKAKTQLPPSISFHGGDLRNSNDIYRLLNGQDAIYLNLNLKPGEKKNDFHAESDGLKIVLAAARKNKIKRIVFISSLVMNYQGMHNFNWWVFDIKHEAVKLIKQSGIPFTIFYPTAFMENFYTTYRKGNKVLIAGEAEAKMYFISAIDYGKQVARSLQLPDENKEYVVQGLEGFTSSEAAEVFVSHHKREALKISKAPLGLLKFLGIFSPTMNYASHIIEALNKYPEKFEATNTWNELGKPTITLRDFAAEKIES